MKEQTKYNAAVLAAYEIAASKAEHLARTGTFALSAITDWEDHRQDAALAIAKKEGEPRNYLVVTGLRALTYSHAAALRDRYVQLQCPQPADPDDPDGRESQPAKPARSGSWTNWRRARATLEGTAPLLDWRTIRTLSVLLATEMDFASAAKRLGVSRATAYRLFQRAAKEFYLKCPLRY